MGGYKIKNKLERKLKDALAVQCLPKMHIYMCKTLFTFTHTATEVQ